MMTYQKILLALSVSAMISFSGCNDSDSSDDTDMNTSSSSSSISNSSQSSVSSVMSSESSSSSSVMASEYSYSIVFTNLTAGQIMSPLIATTNSLYNVGSKASLGLEKLAESGDNSMLLDSNGVSTEGVILPGASATIIFDTSIQRVSLATMLVNTNDAFAGMNNKDISTLAMGESMKINIKAYDAGTEANSEEASSIPGPAGMGEGFNATRDDSDMVSIHAGVMSKDDGLATSALTSLHKFNNPVAAVIITRNK